MIDLIERVGVRRYRPWVPRQGWRTASGGRAAPLSGLDLHFVRQLPLSRVIEVRHSDPTIQGSYCVLSIAMEQSDDDPTCRLQLRSGSVLRLRANHRASPCATAWSVSAALVP